MTDTPNQAAAADEVAHLRADNARLVRALDTIRKVRCGPDDSDTPEQRIEYWSRLACCYRAIAAEALKELS